MRKNLVGQLYAGVLYTLMWEAIIAVVLLQFLLWPDIRKLLVLSTSVSALNRENSDHLLPLHSVQRWIRKKYLQVISKGFKFLTKKCPGNFKMNNIIGNVCYKLSLCCERVQHGSEGISWCRRSCEVVHFSKTSASPSIWCSLHSLWLECCDGCFPKICLIEDHVTTNVNKHQPGLARTASSWSTDILNKSQHFVQ